MFLFLPTLRRTFCLFHLKIHPHPDRLSDSIWPEGVTPNSLTDYSLRKLGIFRHVQLKPQRRKHVNFENPSFINDDIAPSWNVMEYNTNHVVKSIKLSANLGKHADCSLWEFQGGTTHYGLTYDTITPLIVLIQQTECVTAQTKETHTHNRTAVVQCYFGVSTHQQTWYWSNQCQDLWTWILLGPAVTDTRSNPTRHSKGDFWTE